MSWWRDNRLWLLALPLALTGAAAASAYNVGYFWYDAGLHHRVASAEAGERLAVTMDYDDKVGPTSRTFSVELTGLETTQAYPFEDEDGPLPVGVEVVVAGLEWSADPVQVLGFCTVSLVDTDGRRYDAEHPGDVPGCTPAGRGGPLDPDTPDDDRGQVPEGEERPDSWSTEPVFLVPEGREISRVLVWWKTPDYVELSAS